MTTQRPLDPKPVRFRSTSNRTAILALLETHPRHYIFDPRPGFDQDRKNYRNETARSLTTQTRIVGAETEGA